MGRVAKLTFEELGGLLIVLGGLMRDRELFLGAVLDGESQPQIRKELGKELGFLSTRRLDQLSRIDAEQVIDALVNGGQLEASR